MTENTWKDAVSRAAVGAPSVPAFDYWKDNSITFRGWIPRIGGIFPQNLAILGELPPDNHDLDDIQYFGFLRRVVKDPVTGEKKMFVASIGGEIAQQAKPGQSFELKNTGLKIGQFTQTDVDALVEEARQKLMEISDLTTARS